MVYPRPQRPRAAHANEFSTWTGCFRGATLTPLGCVLPEESERRRHEAVADHLRSYTEWSNHRGRRPEPAKSRPSICCDNPQ